MEPFDYFEELGNCRYLFLEQLIEPKRNALRIRLAEGIVSSAGVPVEIASQSFGDGLPVETNPNCARYELTWDSYVLYQVLNEMYSTAEVSARGTVTRLARVYKASSLLDYISRSGNASDTWPGGLLHFQIVCADHVIDVISSEGPQGRKIVAKQRTN